MKDPFRRGCADDLPVPPSTSAQIDGLAHRRNVFDLRLPETLEARDVGIITMPIRQQVHLGWQWHPEGLESRLHLKGEVLVVRRLTAGEDCLHLELVVENLSQADWREARAIVCMRLIAAPDFADACRELTFWWASGKWSMLGSCFPKHCLGPSSQPAMIAVESAPARFVAAMSRQDVWSIAGNDMLHNVCIHADARLEDIPAGGRVAARGLLIFLRGDRNDALERFLRSPLFSQE